MNSTTGASALTSSTGIAAGLIAGVIYSSSPLFTVALGGAALVLWLSARGLPVEQRRPVLVLLATAIALRFAFIGATLISGIPHLDDLSVGALRGDDAYYVSRAIRGRDILLGLTQGKYDYFVVSDEYGRTSYVQLLTVLQVLFGPSPYGMRALNAVLFAGGAAILFRVMRPAFGDHVAIASLAVLLFLPSLFVSSVSLLKEPLYFLTSAALLAAIAALLRKPRMFGAIGAVAMAALCLVVLDDMRRGALVLAVAGVAIGVVMPVALRTRKRALAVLLISLLVGGIALTRTGVRTQALDAVTGLAKTHAGHVFTSGHAYKLLDAGFYVHPAAPAAWPITLDEGQAIRFLLRAAMSFLLTPLPWEMRSLGELAFFPEHALWLVMVVCAPIGIVAGWRLDPRMTALLLGLIVPTAAALAVTNGNVGTLLRLRGLITPYLVWLAVVGAFAIAEWILARPSPARLMHQPEASS